MRRILVLIASFVVCGSAGLAWAGHGTYGGYQPGPQPLAIAPPFAAPDDVGGCQSGPLEDPSGCEAGECGCGDRDACGRCGCQHRLAAKWAEAGYSNCRCRGSYKFPVPPQYTYHWPGMYSQQTMTEYNSPYRFPSLNAPEKAFGQPVEQSRTDPIAAPPASGRSPGMSSGRQVVPEAPSASAKTTAEPKKLPGLEPAPDPSRSPRTTSETMKQFYRVP